MVGVTTDGRIPSDPPLTAGMSAILLEIGAVLDEERFLDRLTRTAIEAEHLGRSSALIARAHLPPGEETAEIT